MGTNYYLLRGGTEPCPTCGHAEPPTRLHIGKSSAGWCFSLHVSPEDDVRGLADWQRLWSEHGAWIENEYAAPVSPDEMLSVITDRLRDRDWDDDRWWNYSILGLPSPYRSEADFHRKNSSERGPCGILRHRVDDLHCIGHGEGTWDLIAGEFS